MLVGTNGTITALQNIGKIITFITQTNSYENCNQKPKKETDLLMVVNNCVNFFKGGFRAAQSAIDSTTWILESYYEP